MKNHLFFFTSFLAIFLIISCNETSPSITTDKIDVTTAEQLVRDFNANLPQNLSQVVNQNFSNDFMFINGEGQFTNKAQMIEVTEYWKVTNWDLDNLKVRVFGNVIVATGINNHTMVSNDNSNTMDFRTAFTYIYQLNNDKLEILSQQHTHVQDETNE